MRFFMAASADVRPLPALSRTPSWHLGMELARKTVTSRRGQQIHCIPCGSCKGLLGDVERGPDSAFTGEDNLYKVVRLTCKRTAAYFHDTCYYASPRHNCSICTRKLTTETVDRIDLRAFLLTRELTQILKGLSESRIQDHWERISSSLEQGADQDAFDHKGFTLLHHAVAQENGEILNQLIDYKCNLNAKTFAGETPLHLAALTGNSRIFQLLVEIGEVDPNALDDDAETALHYAARSNSNVIVSMLLRRDQVNPTISNDEGSRPSDLSTDERITTLLEGAEERYMERTTSSPYVDKICEALF